MRDACIGITSWRSFCLSLLTHSPAGNQPAALNCDSFAAVVVVVFAAAKDAECGCGRRAVQKLSSLGNRMCLLSQKEHLLLSRVLLLRERMCA